MADILTNLRETSFCMGFVLDSIPNNPEQYLQRIHKFIREFNISIVDISLDTSSFSIKEYETIKKGYALGLYVKQTLKIHEIHTIDWIGPHNTLDVVDVIINNQYKFSLKENSYILKNMGLYEMLNIITDSKIHKRGLNVFEQFSDGTILTLFDYVKKQLINYLKINAEFNVKNKYIMSYNNDTLSLNLNGRRKNITNFSSCSYYMIQKLIKNKEFEQTISKFIRYELNLKNDETYNILKQKKSKKTADKLLQYIKDKTIYTNNASLIKLFNIYDYSYFFAKYDKIIDLYYVPSKAKLMQTISIKSIKTSVAQTQLNLITTLYNKVNQKELTLINQLRYSHGQLNGSPEAKLYIDSYSSLDFIYNEIL